MSPANKDRPGSRRTFAAKCAGYLKHGISLIVIDVVTSRSADLHAELLDVLEVEDSTAAWSAPSGLSVIAYRAVTSQTAPSVQVWPEPLMLGRPLPVMPLWLSLNLCVPARLEDSYIASCQSLRISA